MKQMLRHFTITVLLSTIFSFGLYGQLLKGVAFNGGGSSTSFDYGGQTKNITSFDNDSQFGGTGGIKLDFYISHADWAEYITISPEIFLIGNGSDEYYRDFNILQNDIIERNVSLNYFGLYLPITISIPVLEDFSDYTGFLIQGKLFGDLVIGGEITDKAQSSGTLLKREAVQFDKPSDQMDFGFSLEGGFVFPYGQIKNLCLMFGYNWGVKNIEFSNALGYTGNNTDYLINTQGFTMQVGAIVEM